MNKHFFQLAALLPLLFCFPLVTFADATYLPLVGIPGLNDAGNLTMEAYINALYVLSIIAAAFLTVVRLIYAGLQYILSDIVTSKEQAKKDIRNAIVGLLIVLGAVLILETINPQLTKLDVLSKLPDANFYIKEPDEDIAFGLDNSVSTQTKEANEQYATDCINGLGEFEVVYDSTEGELRNTCYRDPQLIDANPGDEIDLSEYSEGSRGEAKKKFRETCEANSGYLLDNSCIGVNPGTKITYGEIDITDSDDIFTIILESGRYDFYEDINWEILWKPPEQNVCEEYLNSTFIGYRDANSEYHYICAYYTIEE